VLLVEHDMTLVMAISDQVVVLDAGQRLAGGSPAQVQSDPLVRQAYLGTQVAAGPSARRAPRSRAPGDELLGVGELTAGYGAAPVLQAISLQVRRGEVVACWATVGKSTLMRSVAGLHRPVQGGLHFDGRELNGLGAEQVMALGLVLVPEGRQVFAELSVLENMVGAFRQPAEREARVEQMLQRFPKLRDRLHHGRPAVGRGAADCWRWRAR
jgi:ABC-type branched-subunit amino acid transport system ATPase component